MVFQSFNLFPHFTVLQNVMVSPVHVLGEPKERGAASARWRCWTRSASP